MTTRKPQLTADQRRRVDRAREVETAKAASLSEGYEYIDPDNQAMVYSYAFGVAQQTIQQLLEVITDLTGGEAVPAQPEGPNDAGPVGWSCEDCGWVWPLVADPTAESECDNCGGQMVPDPAPSAQVEHDGERYFERLSWGVPPKTQGA